MSNYVARVELHSAGYEDYEKLHISMQQRNFSRRVKGDNGVTYQLPTGTYVASNATSTLSVALGAATAAANETGKRHSIIVADWSAARWSGLPVD